ncbi:unnamed protein product [Effrenium voratum]|uniref:Uncharacterized protein n=1 Tax=Effrenium voratum TaxID=2562239 RepID=A0AA36J5I9_9DINO|nr:unnamed protein product [Effrenium voratum]
MRGKLVFVCWQMFAPVKIDVELGWFLSAGGIAHKCHWQGRHSGTGGATSGCCGSKQWTAAQPAQACQGCAAGSVDVCSFWLVTGRSKSIDIHLLPGCNWAGSGLVPKGSRGIHDSQSALIASFGDRMQGYVISLPTLLRWTCACLQLPHYQASHSFKGFSHFLLLALVA